MLENKNNNSQNKKCETNEYQHLDDVINDACLLSNLRKPPDKQTKKDDEGRTIKKAKQKHLSPILFVRFKYLQGKKKNRKKIKLIKNQINKSLSWFWGKRINYSLNSGQKATALTIEWIKKMVDCCGHARHKR